MVVREKLSKLSELALRNRREGLTKLLPPLGEVLRGSLMERYLTCGNPDCKCARGERHGPVWYLSVTQVRRWIENYHRVKENLEKISDINRELMHRLKAKNKKRKSAKSEPSGRGNEGRRLCEFLVTPPPLLTTAHVCRNVFYGSCPAISSTTNFFPSPLRLQSREASR